MTFGLNFYLLGKACSSSYSMSTFLPNFYNSYNDKSIQYCIVKKKRNINNQNSIVLIKKVFFLPNYDNLRQIHINNFIFRLTLRLH